MCLAQYLLGDRRWGRTSGKESGSGGGLRTEEAWRNEERGEGDRVNRREMGGEGKAELIWEEPEQRVAPDETRRWGARAYGERNAGMSPELEEVPGKRKDGGGGGG